LPLEDEEYKTQPLEPEKSLLTPRLQLEPLVTAHAPALYPLLQDSALYTFIPQEPPDSVEALTARYRMQSTRRSPDGTEIWLNWALRLRASDDCVGTLQATVQADSTAFLAYMIFPTFQHRGYAKEGCLCMLEHLRDDYKVRRVVAEIDTRNAVSIGLVESLGFVRAALHPEADFFKGGASDEYRYEYEPAQET
jgi:RimJ/RimL family protein N-acetyltransferase